MQTYLRISQALSAMAEPSPRRAHSNRREETAAGVNLTGLCYLRSIPTPERGLDSSGVTFHSDAEEFVQRNVAFARVEDFCIFLGVFHFLSAVVFFVFGLNHFYHLPIDF